MQAYKFNINIFISPRIAETIGIGAVLTFRRQRPSQSGLYKGMYSGDRGPSQPEQDAVQARGTRCRRADLEGRPLRDCSLEIGEEAPVRALFLR